ncbi:sensor histidine kinase [Leucobacter ruminantium]|uniref:Sensor histidine kinase n=1 Tax=Leucobacter ruminantium TaxID=1289170 RepID=A0A939M0P7_9MICO|nr:sensor histidine kinase [Leucobacter ruminantium]MBO1806428.1 sensor histidine kinase [Leucobacter ruminantium]
MPHSSLDPVFAGLRLGLHALLVGLALFAVARAFAVASPAAPWVAVIAGGFIAVYFAGAWAAGRGSSGRSRRSLAIAWVAALTLLWGLLVWLSPEGAYLVFPLFFLYLHLLPGAGAAVAVIAATGFAILALGLHLGFSVGGVLGPVVGAGVALLIGLAYRALAREAEERERLLAELLRTRERLAETEREQGALAERARLARDIHDTVAQGLSSIQMLLRAAERDVSEPGAAHLRLARETAAESLAETRQIIRELTPERLDEGLPAALRRLGEEQDGRTGPTGGPRVEVAAEDVALPMAAQTALLRIAQGALANAVQHAGASRVSIELRRTEAGQSAPGGAVLVISDDGCGFEPDSVARRTVRSDSFGIRAMRERAEQLGGTLEIDAAPGRGASVTAQLPLDAAAPDPSSEDPSPVPAPAAAAPAIARPPAADPAAARRPRGRRP